MDFPMLKVTVSSSTLRLNFPSLEIPNHRKRECGIRLILAPKSARAFFTAKCLIRRGSVKLPGSPSFWGKLLWMIAEHSSLILTEEAAFSSFSLCERRTALSYFLSSAVSDGYFDPMEFYSAPSSEPRGEDDVVASPNAFNAC
ncbi:hypothetical protein Tco_0541452 [Tanacetum coccineum]